MVEVTIDAIRVSLTSQQRIVVLKEIDVERYLPIWIGPETAEAITMQLQRVAVPRPMTHDLLKNVVTAMGGKVSHIVVNTLKNETFYAQIVMDVNGKRMEIDSRPSDALALAVRANAKIFVEEEVMHAAAITPEAALNLATGSDDLDESTGESEDENLEAFRDFVDSLDLDDLSSSNG